MCAEACLDGSFLENSTLFSGLDRTALDELARLSRFVDLNSGKTLFRQGDRSDGCYIIVKGILRISAISAQGEETLLAMLGSGDIVGEIGLIDGLPRSATATALKPCSVAFLTTHDFNSFAEANPTIYRHILEVVSARLRGSNDAFAAYQLLPLGGRLARVLLRLAEGVGHPLKDGRILIRQKLTQVELARMTGSTRENVNRQLSDWRKKRIVSRVSSYYCLEDEHKLREMAKI